MLNDARSDSIDDLSLLLLIYYYKRFIDIVKLKLTIMNNLSLLFLYAYVINV